MNPSAAPSLVVHLVHGTWPYGPGGEDRWKALYAQDPERHPLPWFHDGSAFCQAVRQHAGQALDIRSFEWSGENSFTERRAASVRFRKHLSKAMRAAPAEARHVVVAHSHGGTVAFDAVADPRRPLPGPLAGLVTMGTPFAALREIEATTTESLVRNVASRWTLVLLLLCAVFAGGLALLIGGPFVLYLLGAVFFAFFAVSSLASYWLVGTTEGLVPLLAPTEPRLPCPLTAYRTPGDEASFAIVAAQFTDWIFTRLSVRWLYEQPVAALERVLGRFGPLFFILSTWMLIVLALLLYDVMLAEALRPLWSYPLWGLLYFQTALAFVLAGFAIVIPLLAFIGALALRMATGPEALRYAGYAAVEAEPLPVGIPATLEVLRLAPGQQRAMKMSHSLHELPITRERIGTHLKRLTTQHAGVEEEAASERKRRADY